MSQFAVIKTGGKQYLVQPNDVIIVDKIEGEAKAKTQFDTLMAFDSETGKVETGAPVLKSAVQAEIVEQVKGDKIRVAKFKSKVRYRKVRGFRAQLTKVKIVSL
jgi:large subunit ribosomal protein L21